MTRKRSEIDPQFGVIDIEVGSHRLGELHMAPYDTLTDAELEGLCSELHRVKSQVRQEIRRRDGEKTSEIIEP